MPWENHNLKRHKHPSVHCSTVHNSQDMEATARKRLSLWLLKDAIMVKVCDLMTSRAPALDPSSHNYLSLFSLLGTIIYISISQSNSWLCFVKKAFCAKWVWKTLYIYFSFGVCVCVCLCSSKTCLLTLIFEFHSVFMFSWNLSLPHPSIKHCKNHLAGWIQPTGRNFPTPSLGWGSTVHITRVRESALALQQPGGCDSNGLVSAYLTRSVVNSDTPDFSLLLEIFSSPALWVPGLACFFLHLGYSLSVVLCDPPSSVRFHSTWAVLCSVL